MSCAERLDGRAVSSLWIPRGKPWARLPSGLNKATWADQHLAQVLAIQMRDGCCPSSLALSMARTTTPVYILASAPAEVCFRRTCFSRETPKEVGMAKGRARSAITGRYVSKATAKRSPRTTVVESVGSKSKAKSRKKT